MLPLHNFHLSLNASFLSVADQEVVARYGDPMAEYDALNRDAVILDWSFRGRLCLTGSDRQRFINGQVTNDVNRLKPGQGCYAALVTAKGKMVSDLNIYVLENEVLIDFEPGLMPAVLQRLEKFIIADDVQVVDVSTAYGLLSVQGPKTDEVIHRVNLEIPVPSDPMSFTHGDVSSLGKIYLMQNARLGTRGFDLFCPVASLPVLADRFRTVAAASGARFCGWEAFEMARIEAGIPRFGADMDETNLPPEAGLEGRAISYTKGCYTGQEVIARIRTYGQVAKKLCGLKLAPELSSLPQRGDKLSCDGKEAGFITSAVWSPRFRTNIALGYVRREFNAPGTPLVLGGGSGESQATVVALPFRTEDF